MNGIGQQKQPHKEIFVHYTCAINRDQVSKIFNSVQRTIITANLERAALI